VITLPSIALDLLASLVAPPRCAACDAPVPRLSVFCAPCASTAERAHTPDPRDIAAFVYGGALQKAITRFKYERRPDLARPLGDLLWSSIEPHSSALGSPVVIPVPLHPVRLAERGYNQSALLARRIAGRLGAPFVPMALGRTKDTPRQATLDREARGRNVAGAFRVHQPRRLEGRVVLLIDDVRTTGSTLAACAGALVGAGAARVATAVLARAQ